MTKLYRRSDTRTRNNQKAPSMTNVLRMKTNQNAFKPHINKQKYAENEAEYEESSITDEVPSYFTIFEYGRIF